MLLMKNWLETRWRVTATVVYVIAFLAIHSHNPQPAEITHILIPLFMILTYGALTLAGAGVKTQSPIGFPEGLAESTQFTLALPVSRLRLMAVRVTVGMFEVSALTILTAGAAWALFSSLRASTTPADFVRVVLTTLLWLTGPYCAALLFETLLTEPFSMVVAGWVLMLLLWLLHRLAPAVDIMRGCFQASPLITHRLPWSQMATAAGMSLMLFLAAVWIVRAREY
ncbi:MAG TPA: hypothetical protein VKU19_40580 [Bryobacteraceae bacterium]|nr:hypothetical protein [Bryobacteraceae bacterium]